MSLYLRSYLQKDNILIKNELKNLGNAPELTMFVDPITDTYSRYIFNIDLSTLKKYRDSCIINDLDKIEHKLYIKTNLKDNECITNGINLFLYEVNELYDEGCGNSLFCDKCISTIESECKVDSGPSNWIYRRFNETWNVSGAVDTLSGIPITEGYFEVDLTNDYNITFNVTDFINEKIQLSGDSVSLIMTFSNEIENNYNNYIGFNIYSSEHPTFFKPFLESKYDNPLIDDRNNFILNTDNNLFFRTLKNGLPVKFDSNPNVQIYDSNENLVDTLSGSCVGYGFYKTVVNISGEVDTCNRIYNDIWTDLYYNSMQIPDQSNTYFINDIQNVFIFNENIQQQNNIKLKVRGVIFDENIKASDNKVIYVDILKNERGNIKKTYFNNIFYRIYVMQGQNKFFINDWIQMNQTFCQNWFYLDTSWMLSSTYYVDMKIETDMNTYQFEKIFKFNIKEKASF